MSYLGSAIAYIWTLYNAAVAALAAMTTDRNTWQTRANDAWGATHVWNSGTSFESAYTTAEAARVAAVALAAANVPAALDTITGTVINSIFGSATVLMSLTVDRTGYWAAAAYCKTNAGTASKALEIRYNGSAQPGGSTFGGGADSGYGVIAAPALLTSGQTIEFVGTCTSGGPASIAGGEQNLKAFFVPTPTYPH